VEGLEGFNMVHLVAGLESSGVFPVRGAGVGEYSDG